MSPSNPEPQDVTLFGTGVFADVIGYEKVRLV